MAANSMFAGYNKVGLHGTRLGNWQEELALKDLTGHNRSPAPGSKDFNGNYGDRVITHSDAVAPHQYKSTALATHGDPKSVHHAQAPSATGSRKSSSAAAVRAMVEAEFKESDEKTADERKRGLYNTISRDSFVRHDGELYETAIASGKTKQATMKATHAKLAVDYPGRGFDAAGDEPPPLSARTLESADKISHASYDEGDAVTIYSESFVSGENRFPMTSIAAPHAPFGRSSNFTNEIHDAVKVHSEALDVIDAQSHAASKKHTVTLNNATMGATR